ncbi:MAG TPA: hypothetical protein VNQ76_04690 [Planctomicrobium sp.]|nr:hypothetical protein [Planctomicrobium sp.]
MLTFSDALKLSRLPFRNLNLVRHLEEYEGPLLSHYVQEDTKEHYLKYWCDCDSTHHRWMWLRVQEASILRIVNRFVPLTFVIPQGCRDNFVYFADETHCGKVEFVSLVDVTKIPDQYTPQESAYLSHIVDVDEKTYALVIEKGWSISELGTLPWTFSRAYSFLYGLNVLHVPSIPSFPWKRDGFSAMHVFNWFADRIPAEHRSGIQSMQFASPGFIRFSMHAGTAREVVECVSQLKKNNATIASIYSDLDSYIKANKLNDIETSDDPKWQQHEKTLAEYAVKLIDSFNVTEATAFIAMCERPFEAAKLAGSFYRRIRELVKYEKDDLVRYPTVSE